MTRPSSPKRLCIDCRDHPQEEIFSAWERCSPNPDEIAAGEARVREFWGDRYQPMCSCEFPADRTPDGRCARCQGLPNRIDHAHGKTNPEDTAGPGW